MRVSLSISYIDSRSILFDTEVVSKVLLMTVYISENFISSLKNEATAISFAALNMVPDNPLHYIYLSPLSLKIIYLWGKVKSKLHPFKF